MLKMNLQGPKGFELARLRSDKRELQANLMRYFGPSILAIQTMGLSLALTSVSALAQITPDATLRNPSQVQSAAQNVDVITGGTTQGNNLFHSFRAFSLPTGQTAQFQNALNITNIYSRVTGNRSTNINGTLQTRGNANLIILNPNGINFGPRATLNIGGSFLATTANSIQFDNQQRFSADQPQDAPLLNINRPIGLNFGNQVAPINAQGEGHRLSIDPDFLTVDDRDRPNGLRVPHGQTLAFIGGDINLDGANLTARDGRILLAAVGRNQFLGLQADPKGFLLNPASINRFQNVALFNSSSLLTSGNGSGFIDIHGRFIDVLEGSAAISTVLGLGNTGTDPFGINLSAREEIVVNGATFDNAGVAIFPSSILSEVGLDVPGNGANIQLRSPFIFIEDGGQVSTSTFGFGNSGSINVDAEVVELTGGGFDLGASGFYLDVADFLAEGTGGVLNLNTGELIVQDGAIISANTFGFGNGGIVNINAPFITLQRGGGGLPSGISVQTENTGRGGSINILSQELSILEGAQIVSTAFFDGDGGDITLDSVVINLDGTSPLGTPSGIFSLVEVDFFGDGARGSAAPIVIDTQGLIISNGAQISQTTFGQGNAGRILVNGETIELIGVSDRPTGIFNAAGFGSTGNGNNIELVTQQLDVLQGAQIVSGTRGPGNGGDIIIRAKEVNLSGRNADARSGLFANATQDNGGGGNIQVNSEQLFLLEGATINASNFGSIPNRMPAGTGTAGNVTIISPTLVLDNSLITTSTSSGNQGNIRLTSQDIIYLNNESAITANSNTSVGGNVTIMGGTLFAQGNSDITANALLGQGGRVDITNEFILGLRAQEQLTGGNDITATSSLGPSFQGIVNVESLNEDPSNKLSELPENIIIAKDLISQSCFAPGYAKQGQFRNVGKGGLKPTPNNHPLSLFSLNPFESKFSDRSPTQHQSPDEALGFTQLSNGAIALKGSEHC